ncbi:DNA alkylation repair protein [Candidatus Woesearchaeota archaeon]|nr:DNA alkylation repair protein [Candidatus Woesearchaeota archaeon]
MSLAELKKEVESLADKKQAANLQRFFKTGPGEYGEGDVFLGLKVPVQRSVAKRHKDLSLNAIQQLLDSKIHEYRLIALLILMQKYYAAEEDSEVRKEIFGMYLKNTHNINNWDLIDLSSPNIIGNYLLDKPRGILYKLAKSKSIWEKRIAMLATFEFIANGEAKDALAIAEALVNDKHDLIQKAVGWMLREVGKRVSQVEEEKFLKKHYKTMPRTMLRYAIERFDKKKKEFYMRK